MTPKERAAIQQALECLNTLISHHTVCYLAISESGAVDAEYALREALAEQAEQEPVAWMSPGKERLEFSTKSTVYGSHTIPLYAAPVRTKDLTDVADLQDAVTKALKKAFHLGQTYWQQADSESYAANKRANVTQELYWKLEGDTRAVIAADREKNK